MTTQTLKVLTAAQAEKFWKDGYLVLPAFLSDGDVSALRDSLAVLDDWVQAHSHPDFTHEPDSRDLERTVIRKITNIHVHGGAPWRELMERSDVLDLFEDLIGPDIAFHHSKAMMKPPHEGSAKPWHQDLPEGFISPDEADRLRPLGNDLQPEHVPVVAIQYYVDDSTLENGCIQVVPGSHRRGLFEDPLDESLIDPAEVVAAEVPAGGALLFHCLTYHYSAAAATAVCCCCCWSSPRSCVLLRLLSILALRLLVWLTTRGRLTITSFLRTRASRVNMVCRI